VKRQASTLDSPISSDTDALAVRLMSKAKVMMVDDEPINMSVLQLHLKSEGYERFVSVSDSTQAYSTIVDEQPDVLLLDMNMPEVSGLDILKMVRSDEKHKRLPIIVLTSSHNPDIKLDALQFGATDFLSKPVDASELALRMRNTLVARAYEQRLMNYDSLTNLPNRQYFTREIQKLLGTRVPVGNSYALVLINVSRFKSINETFGPNRGDDLLWALSQRLHKVVESLKPPSFAGEREDSANIQFLARLGGDRFGVCLAATEPVRQDQALQETLNAFAATVELPFVVDAQNVFLSLQMGISKLDDGTMSVEFLINEAETAMNHVQSSVGSCYSFFSNDMFSAARRRLKLENLLRTCVKNDELLLLFQPKVCCKTDRITSAEALVRWEHSELGSVSPVDFIPVAESSGMIVEIGRWVLDAACAQAHLFRKYGFPDFKIAVNVSISQLYESDFIESVSSALHKSQLPPDALIIELTENMIMENVEETIRKLAKLRNLGIKISVDDFGTGYSSLSYLQRFPIDQLKVDRSFIMQIESADSKAPIVRAVVSLAHDLGLNVVAEGVEDVVQRDYVAALGCEEYQGFLKSRPLTAFSFIKLLQEDQRKCA
jgi:diguanylate cyclase (GGDEF)-like protein